MMSTLEFAKKKLNKQKISMITCYDSWSAKIISETDIDCVLVGDSLSMVMHGHDTTLNASVNLMALHVSAVSRGLKNKFIVGDLPFLSYRKDLRSNMLAVEKIMKAGAHAVKLEGTIGHLDLIQHIVNSGVPVMGHLGLTPQSVFQLGGFKVQGQQDVQKRLIKNQAQQLEQAGCFSVVLECVPSTLAKDISTSLHIPTIGIGAGVDCDGQVLVLHDMLGLNNQFQPKFLKKYLSGFELIKSAINQYHADVCQKAFPSPKESYQ